MYQSILLAIDTAQVTKANSMIELARTLAGSEGRIILLNVIEDVPHWVASTLPAGFLDDREKDAMAELKKITDNANVEAVVKVRGGHASQTIISAAEELNVDLIVVASHKPEMKDYFLGSTASNVVRHASCSVMVQR